MNELIKDKTKNTLKIQLKNIILWTYIEILFQFLEIISVIIFALSFTPILTAKENNMMFAFWISISLIIVFICIVAGIFAHLNQLIIKLPIDQFKIKELQFINIATCVGNTFLIFGFIAMFILINSAKKLIKQEETKIDIDIKNNQ